MELAGDLTAEAVAAAVPEREVRAYPALLSTESEALAWARAGAPDGAVVVAEYQASPRGRAGLEWHPRTGASLAFSIVLRPKLPPHREGWLYVAASSALAGVVEGDATFAWPDEVHVGGTRAAAIGTYVDLLGGRISWAVLNVLLERAEPPRAELLARAVAAIDDACRASAAPLLADYLRRCETLGQRVRARMIPMGPGGVVIEGRAANVRTDGSLVVETGDGRRLALRPQSLGVLETL